MDKRLNRISTNIRGLDEYKLDEQGISNNSYLICHQSFRDVLYSPHLAGRRLQERMKKAGVTAAKAIIEMALSDKGVKKSNLCELVILSGGLFYELNYGFSQELEVSLPQCFLGVSRRKKEGTAGDFYADATYANFEALPDDATILIGDTLATGVSAQKGILELGRIATEQDKKIDKIIFFSLAPPLRGMRSFCEACEQISEEHDGMRYYFLGAQQVFHLMEDGTDLRFRGKDAIIPAAEIEYSREIWGEWLCENMKCAIFDWGTRCKNPILHWNEFEEFATQKLDECDEKGCAVLEKMLDELREMREEYQKEI